MNNYVVMPKEHWENALDSVRAKAQITDAIRSGDLSAIIDSIGVKALNIPHLTHIAGGVYIPIGNIKLSDITLTHNMGVKANFVIVFAEEKPTANIVNAMGTLEIYVNVDGLIHSRYYYAQSDSVYERITTGVGGDENSLGLYEGRGIQAASGKKYLWVCGRIG